MCICIYIYNVICKYIYIYSMNQGKNPKRFHAEAEQGNKIHSSVFAPLAISDLLT